MIKNPSSFIRQNPIVSTLVLAGYVAAVAALCSACGDDEEGPNTETCPVGFGHILKDGTCAGILHRDVCSEEYCADPGISCKKTYYVSANAASGGGGTRTAPFTRLSDAAKVADSGDCVLVGRGEHTGTEFRGGINVQGTGAGGTVIKPASGTKSVLKVKDGSGGVIRGMSITGGAAGIAIDGAHKLRVEQVRISGTSGVGLHASSAKELSVSSTTVYGTKLGTVGAGADKMAMGIVLSKVSKARLTRVLVQMNPQIGILGSDSDMEVSWSAVVDNGSFEQNDSRAVSLVCTSVDTCKALGASKLTDVELYRNYGVGVFMEGTRAELSRVKVSASDKTNAGVASGVFVWPYWDRVLPISPGKFYSAALNMSGSAVEGCKGPGVTVELSTATLEDNTISKNEGFGIRLQTILSSMGQKVRLERNTVEDNRAAAIVGIKAEDVTIKGGTASRTKLEATIAGAKFVKMGDGMQILDGSKFTVESVSLVKNERASIVVDASTATVSNCTITRKDPSIDDGILAQNGGKVTATNNKDGQGKPLSAVQVKGVKVTVLATPR